MSSTSTRDVYLVIGGSGFLGRHIVNALLARGDIVSVFDIVQRYDDVPFFSGDISDEAQVGDALKKSGTTCIIHTASPAHGLEDPALYWKVNVDGTKAVIAAAQACGVRKLVYTSSAGVVFNGADIIDVDERAPFPEKAMDAYNESKAKAEEMVLAANGKQGLLTIALRPAGIFGPGDRQVMAGFVEVYKKNQTHFQIGDNNNLFDWTYVENVAHAHLLAADKLNEPPLTPEQKNQLISNPLPQITATTGKHKIPTSESRPLGPAVVPPPNAAQIQANWENPEYTGSAERPLRRNRFDQFSETSLSHQQQQQQQSEEEKETDSSSSAIWARLDQHYGEGFRTKKSRITLPKEVGMIFAGAAEWWGWLSGKEPTFTRFRVKFTCASRWHNIEKSRRLLGYEPVFGIEEGINKMVDWYVSQNPIKN
ncbi:hypothetical protein ABKN59_010242 [Abortiporus biennis]